MSRTAYRIGIDVGGTFTKAALIDNSTHAVAGRSSVHTTHDHPQGVASGVVQVFNQVLHENGIDPKDVVFIAHSTTQATNALLEGDVAHVGVLGMAAERAAKLAKDHVRIEPIELAPGRVLRTSNRFLLSESVEHATVEEAVAALVDDGAEVLVASEAFGVDETSSEELVREVGKERNMPTTCGHEISRLYGLATRTRTAVVNASILPRMIATADMTEKSVKSAGIDAPLMIMRSDGGVMDIHEMRRRPAMTMLSGPAASVAGVLMHNGMSDGIYFEVGGTSTNIGVMKNGRPTITYANVGGHSTYMSSLDVRVLGVAGGSLIKVDAGAVQDVGPRSAHIAGLGYACFADSSCFANAEATFFEPKAGDGNAFVAIDTLRNGRLALTATCAANAWELTTPDMHCYAPPQSARAAFGLLASQLRTDVDTLIRSTLETAAKKIIPIVQALIKEYQLDSDQRVLIGAGGGVGALLPFIAAKMALRYEMSKDAEIISSIGAALAMVREVVERANPNPSSEDVAALRAEALEAVVRAGADQKSVSISIEIDRNAGRLRAIAAGSAALRIPDERRSVSEATAREIAATSFNRPGEALKLAGRTPGAYVYTFDSTENGSVRVVDWDGNVRFQRSAATVRSITCGGWHDALSAFKAERYPASIFGDDFGGAVLLYDRHIIDLTGLQTFSQTVEVVRGELEGIGSDKQLLFIGFDSAERN